MIGDAWDFCQILEWSDQFWVDYAEYDYQFRIELASAVVDLARCFDASVKAHTAAFNLNERVSNLSVRILLEIQ